MNARWFVAGLLACVALAGAAPAQAPARIDSVEIVEYGLYTTDSGGDAKDVTVVTGSTVVNRTNIRHAATTKTVPGQIGVHFGYRYVVKGAPAGAPVTLRAVTIFPAPGIRDPATGTARTRSEYTTTKSMGVETYRDYSFDRPEEIVPGVWTFELWAGERKLSSTTFTVIQGAGGV